MTTRFERARNKKAITNFNNALYTFLHAESTKNVFITEANKKDYTNEQAEFMFEFVKDRLFDVIVSLKERSV